MQLQMYCYITVEQLATLLQGLVPLALLSSSRFEGVVVIQTDPNPRGLHKTLYVTSPILFVLPNTDCKPPM
jgi:hypothetical protein